LPPDHAEADPALEQVIQLVFNGYKPYSLYMPRPVFYVIAGDLVRSRAIPDRAGAARALRPAIARATGQAPASHWLAPLAPSLGIDEVRGVLRSPEHVVAVICSLWIAAWPLRFRFSIASGPIDIGLRLHDAAAMDGPAFHAAADALGRARREGLALALSLAGLDAPTAGLAEAAASLYHETMSGWSARTAEVIGRYRRSGNQSKAARALGITQQAVSDTLIRAQWRTLEKVEQSLSLVLASLERSAANAAERRPRSRAG
jgi:hypothetical protein